MVRKQGAGEAGGRIGARKGNHDQDQQSGSQRKGADPVQNHTRSTEKSAGVTMTFA